MIKNFRIYIVLIVLYVFFVLSSVSYSGDDLTFHVHIITEAFHGSYAQILPSKSLSHIRCYIHLRNTV